EEFKQQIVDVYNMGNKSLGELEGEYGVSKSTMNGWIKKLSIVKVSSTESITMKEYQVLQKKIRELELENEICR
ncbi:MAG: IS3 family transposase, partial [Oscillospiraceae bacterium]